MMTAHDKNWVEQMLLGWENLSKKEKKEVYKALKSAKWYWLDKDASWKPYKGWLNLEELDNTYWKETSDGLLGLNYLKNEGIAITLPGGGWLGMVGDEDNYYVLQAPELGLTYISLYEPEHSPEDVEANWFVAENGYNFVEDDEADEEDHETGRQVKEFLESYQDLFSLLNDCIVLKGRFLKLGNYVLICNPTKLVTSKPVVGDKRLLLHFKSFCVREDSEASLVPA